MIGVKRVFTNAAQLIQLSSNFQGRATVNFPLLCLNSVRCNSTRATVCRINRLQYLRQYPTRVVNPDGSTFTIRYHEPRQIIKLPLDINALSEREKKHHLLRRKPKTKVNIDEEFEEVEFDSSKYLKLVKKK